MPEGTLPRRPTGSTRPRRMPVDESFGAPDVDVPPPAYGEHHNQLQFSQAGYAADAAVTSNGRVSIHINEKNRRLHELLAPALQRQLRAEAKPPSGPLPPPYIPPSLGGLPGQTPPPRLNVVIQIVGSRGDVQPFVALGQVLRDTYGHRVRLATHANFRSFVEENGLEFFNIGGDPAQLMAFMVKNPGLMPGLDSFKSGEIKRRRQEIREILMGCWRSCIEAGDGMGMAPPQHRRTEPVDERFVLPGDPGNRPFVADAIIANPPSFAHVHIAEKLGIPLHIMFTMPWTPTRAFPHPLADIVSTNTDAAIANYVSYALVEMMTWQGLGDVINHFRTNILELDPLSLLWAPGLLNRLRVPATYCWSPALTPKPVDWTAETTVSGFFFLNLESNYTPDPALAAFLAAGPPPVYIGFGSIVVDDPDALTQTIFSAIIKAGVRAIVSQGWGGIGGDAADIPEGVFMLGNCPHDWLFKRVSAVVHHGGAGTTAAGIKAGKPTVVVPFFGDQIFWGSMVAKAGAGPAPIPFKKLTAENLGGAIQMALLPATQARAQELGEKIKAEKGADVGGKSFHQFLNTDNMRCSLAPSRVAVWRVRRSSVKLSALAAAVLVSKGWVKYSDLKLYRSIEYNTDEQPWDPISAVILALVGDIGSLTMTLADFPREVFKNIGKKDNPTSNDAKDGATTPTDAASTLSGTTRVVTSPPFQSNDSRSDLASITSSSALLSSAHGSAETLPLQSSSATTLSADTTTTLSPLQSTTSTSSTTTTRTAPPPIPPRSPQPPPAEGSSLDMAIAAGKGVGALATSVLKFQADICLGLARGFRNAPKLYNDETVRPPEKVTGLVSGMRVAGREFGLGLYDGISGLVTQPIRGGEKEGARGVVKGFGKGLGGVVLKSAAAACALPAYAMQGVRVEVRNMFARSSVNYVITSRVLQGKEDLAGASEEERRDVAARWLAMTEELRGFYLLKARERSGGKAEGVAAAAAGGGTGAGAVTPDLQAGEQQRGEGTTSDGSRAGGATPPRGPWYRRRAESSTSTLPPAAGEGAVQPQATTTSGSVPSSSVPVPLPFEDNEALERAIQQSVAQTSAGDTEEDARIEAAVRASVAEMRRAAEEEQQQGHANWIADVKGPLLAGGYGGGSGSDDEAPLTDEEWTNISDDEYQALVEEAVRQSLLQQQMEEREQALRWQWAAVGDEAGAPGWGPGLPEEKEPSLPEEKVLLRDVLATSSGAGEDVDTDEDEQLRLAMEESEREHRSHAEEMARQQTEEDIVLEYIKRQSLAEEEYRRAKAAGKAKAGAHDDDEDEDLRRALEESLKMSRGPGGSGGHGAGPSRFQPE